MPVIENFAVLSEQEQQEFATSLLKTINSGHIFSQDIELTATDVYADDISGDLVIGVSHGDPIEVPREATWQCEESKYEDEDYSEDDPGYSATYDRTIYEDVASMFKTLAAEVGDYFVELEVNDADAVDTVNIHAEHVSHEDSGVGSYEYGDIRGYDSHPYVEVEGTITQACECQLFLVVTPRNVVKL
jgi:hypothetical protein